MIVVLTTLTHYEDYLDDTTNFKKPFVDWLHERVEQWARDFEFRGIRFCKEQFNTCYHLPFEVEDDSQAILLKMVWG